MLPSVSRAGTESPLEWQDCGGGFECGTLGVPVDYDDPDGEQVDLRVMRSHATMPDERLGSLFVNYGGPGDPATETLRAALSALPPVIQQRFDVVTFDPRGTGASHG